MEFLNASGLLSKQAGVDSQRAASDTLQSVAKTLFLHGIQLAKVIDGSSDTQSILKAMRYIIQSTILLQEYALINLSDGSALSSVMRLHSVSDTVSNILLRSDAGIGEEIQSFWTKFQNLAQQHHRQCTSSIITMFDTFEVSNSPSSSFDFRFHENWYIGDGLLLPPLDAIHYSMQFCSNQLKPACDGTAKYADPNFPIDDDLHNFLSSRGALNLALRVATVSTVKGNFNLDDIFAALAERCLGSSGSGIVSGIVDSQQAVVHLMSIPTRKAFKVCFLSQSFNMMHNFAKFYYRYMDLLYQWQ